MEFESPDVEKDFPGLYASESGKKSTESDFSDDAHDKVSKKDLLIGKRKDKKDTKKDLRYATLEGESSPEDEADLKSPSKVKKLKPFKFSSTKKEKREKSREKDGKEKESEKEKEKKKDSDKEKDKKKDSKTKNKLKERKKVKHGEECVEIAEEHPIFGVPLSVAVERSRCHDGVEIPLVVRECIDHIQEIGLSTEGLYKVSGKSKAQSIRRLYNQRETVVLSEYDLPAITSLLKTFLRELPEPILTPELVGKFEEAAAGKESVGRGQELKALVDKLPVCNRQLLAWLIKHFLAVTNHEKVNKMNVQTMAATMSPILQVSPKLVVALLHHCDTLFPDCKLSKYVPPLSCGSPSLPDTRDTITEELLKQESLLGQLHSEMLAGIRTKDREERLWEVQRIITQLKRKLRVIERTVEHTQRSVEEPDGGKVEEELNLNLQTSSPNQQVVEAVIEKKPDSIPDAFDIQDAGDNRLEKLIEMAPFIEAKELICLARTLQALIDKEKAEVVRLRNQIKAYGGIPTSNQYDFDIYGDGVSRETANLQSQKQTLISSLHEERMACVQLQKQIKLAQMAKA